MPNPEMVSGTVTEIARTPEYDPRRWFVVPLLFCGILINYLDRGNLSLAAPSLMQEFHLNPILMGTLLSAFLWTYATLQIPAGFLVDRFGIKWTYAAAFLLWSLASAGMGLAHSFTQLILLRMLLGVGEAVAPVASVAYLRQNFLPHQQGLPTAIYVSGMTLGPTVGALIGSVLITSQGWRMMFVVTGLGALIWLVPWITANPSIQRNELPQTRAGTSPPWRMLLSLRTFWGITIGTFFYSYFSYFCLTWIPAYLVMDRGYSFLKMGAFTGIPYFGTAVVSLTSARIADRLIARHGHPMRVRRAFVCAGFLFGSSLMLLVLARSSSAVLATLLLSLLGVGFASSNFWALSEAIMPARIAGRFMGYQNMIASVAGVFAPLLTGFFMARTNSFRVAILCAGGAMWIATAVYLSMLREADVSVLAEKFDLSV
jgi:MFS family permease